MPKSKRTFAKPPELDLDGAQERLGRIDHRAGPAASVESGAALVPLVEDDSGHRFLVYATDKGLRVDPRYEGSTFWASQGRMAEMFGVDRRTVNEHLKNIFGDGELVEAATCRNFRQVRTERSRQVERDIPYYDLNALISVGYRVGSRHGTMFRIWATDKLCRLPTMDAVRDKLIGFIKVNQWALLVDRGQHSREDADRHALEQYATWRVQLNE